jgi:hypothetical protein
MKLAWSQQKVDMARHNTMFKRQKVCQLAEAGLEEFNAERLQDDNHHNIQVEQKMWNLDYLTDTVLDQHLINTR